MEEKLCLGAEEMGKQLGISRAVAYELTRQKGFPAVRLGRRIVIPARELMEWLKHQSEGAKRV